ncbi:MAG TPA: HAMP domain-containing sensor histidine kinase [Vicinamibacterales bacterium]|nr:HAMP domain-containing sensor histidine kinase [Vicinamibacterales bacterium]
MTLARRHILSSLALALPAALILFYLVNVLEARDRVALLDRAAEAHVSSIMRDACEQDPRWFLAGPRAARPTQAERQAIDADVTLPRPSADQLPFEIFAYDDQYSPSSSAGPRFPDTFKRALRASSSLKQVSGEYESKTGTGLQTAVVTGWTPGPCAILLFRQQPAPGRFWTRTIIFVGLFAAFFLVGLAATMPTGMRMRNLSLAARQSAKQDYSEIVRVSGADEVGSFGALFNEMAADLRRKTVDARDREEILRRYVENMSTDVGEPLAELERRLGGILDAHADPDIALALKEAHRLSMQVRNNAAVIRLRGVTDESAREPVDLSSVVAGLVADRAPLAAASHVRVDTSKATTSAVIQADRFLIEQAVGNVLDNAIIYNDSGGLVRIELHAYDQGRRISLLIADTGPGVSDEQFEGLTANKRFRGDESRTRRAGGRGLGLALAREVADRFGLKLDLRQPTSGGLEAEFSTRTS